MKVSGGDNFDKALADRVAKLTKARTVQVGFPAGATYPDGTSVPMIAAINEYGAPSRGIPPRPFMRGLIAEKGHEWPDGAAEALKRFDYDAEKALGAVGEAIAGQLRDAISRFDSVPLAPATIKRKGSDKQLVDSGHLLDSVVSQVVKSED